MASGLLNTAAVARRSGEEAGEILGAYIQTAPTMMHNNTKEPEAAQQPRGAGGAVDPTR